MTEINELKVNIEETIDKYEKLLKIKDKQIKVLLNHVAKTSMPVQMNAINKILEEITENELKND